MNGSEKEPLLPGPVISDSGPLIALATTGKLDLLKALFDRILIPQTVYDEVVVYGEGEPGSRAVGEAEWIGTLQAEDRLAVDLLRETLDTGESEAIVLAQETGLIPTVKPILDELRQTEFRMSDRLYQKVLARAGEA